MKKKTLNEWMTEQQQLCEKATPVSADPMTDYVEKCHKARLSLPTALRIIRAAVDANSPDEVVELAEQIINEVPHA